MSAVHFPKDFALGAASAATQIDGDCKESNWYEWYKNGKIKDTATRILPPITAAIWRKIPA